MASHGFNKVLSTLNYFLRHERILTNSMPPPALEPAQLPSEKLCQFSLINDCDPNALLDVTLV